MIGQVGDSGNSGEPHLHLQVQNRPTFDLEDRGLRTYPMLFRDATVADVRRGDSVGPRAGGRNAYRAPNQSVICWISRRWAVTMRWPKARISAHGERELCRGGDGLLVLTQVADQVGAPFIVVGTHGEGRGRLNSLLLGHHSVSHATVKLGRHPVLVVPQGASGTDADADDIPAAR